MSGDVALRDCVDEVGALIEHATTVANAARYVVRTDFTATSFDRKLVTAIARIAIRAALSAEAVVKKYNAGNAQDAELLAVAMGTAIGAGGAADAAAQYADNISKRGTGDATH